MKLAFRAQTQLNTTVSLLRRFTLMAKEEGKKETSETKRQTPASPRGAALVSRAANQVLPKRQTELVVAASETTHCQRNE